MAEGEGTSFENPAYDPYGLDDDDDDEGGDVNETTPFIPENSSTPHDKEEIPMQTMQTEKSGLPATSYAETSFTGAQTLSEQAWVATKDIYPDMSSSELEVSYSSKGKLQVKMFGAGKKTYDLFTKNRRTGKDQINPDLSREIKKALGPSKYEKARQTIYEKRKELKEKQYEALQKEKNRKEMDEIREALKKKQQQIEALENEEGSQEEIDKLKRELGSLETQHQKAKSAYDGSAQAVEDSAMLGEDVRVLEDSQAVDIAEKEKEEASEAFKSIKRRKQALENRRKFELGRLLDNEETDFTPERKKEAEEKISAIDQETKRLNEEEKEFQTVLGARKEYMGKEMKLLQIDKEELEKA